MKNKKRIRINRIKSAASYVVIAAMAIFCFGFVLKIANVSGNSMNNTYQDGDILMCLRMKEPQKGDVVIFDTGDYGILIKRIIATEGDRVNIDFDSGEVELNGETLSELYIKEKTHLNEGTMSYPVTVPENCYFVMGDNRNNSSDSRNDLIGFVDKDQIQGVVWFKIF